MPSINETLRQERLGRNLDLDDISRELKISRKFLDFIEDGKFDKLPGGVFAKSFVRQYARYLGLDEEEAVSEVQRSISTEPPIPDFAEAPRHAPPEIHVPRVDAMPAIGGGSRFSVSSSLPAFALVVLAMFSCAAIYSWLTRHPQFTGAAAPEKTQAHSTPPVQTPAPAQTAPAQTSPATPAPAPAQDTPPASQPETHAAAQPAAPPKPSEPAPSQPPAADTDANRAAADAPPGSGGPVHVEITADEPVWLLARTDGKFSFSGTLDTHQTRTVEANNSVVLRLGNAGGVQITLNGKPLGVLGPKGQVRTVQFTSGGFQIVAAPKPSLPPDPLDRL